MTTPETIADRSYSGKFTVAPEAHRLLVLDAAETRLDRLLAANRLVGMALSL